MALNLGYNAWTDTPQVPWAIVPISLNAFGIALVFPIVTLAILDMYPRQRGAASSLQAFTSLVVASLVAGVVSPWLSNSAMALAVGATVLVALGWVFWRWETMVSPNGGRRGDGASPQVPGPL